MANRTVLLIDYEPRSIEDTRRPLEEAGFAVEIAHDGVAGLEAFHRVHPDLVLVEAMLPKKHGFDVCQEIKNSADGKDTPVVITTGVYRGRKYRTQALQNFGCDEYLEKPFTDDALLDACNRFIAREIADSPDAPAAETATTDPHVDHASDVKTTGALDLERMTEDEISSRLDTLLADFGEAVDAAQEPSDEDRSTDAAVDGATVPAPTPMPSDRESIFETDARAAADDAAAVDADPPPIDLPTVDEVASDDAPAGPASAVFAVSADTTDAVPGAPAMGELDVIPTVPVEARSPAPEMPVGVDLDADLRDETEVPKPPAKSTVLVGRPADPASRRWLVPVVAVVVLGAVVTGGAIWMTSRPSDDGAPAAPSRKRVTFESSAAARAGFADDAPVLPVDGLGSPTVGAEQGLEIDPTVSAPEPIAGAALTESVDGPAVTVRDPAPVPVSVPTTETDPPARVVSDPDVADSKPDEEVVEFEPDPAPAIAAVPVAVAEESPAASIPPPRTEEPRSTGTVAEVPAVVAPATAAVAAPEVVESAERSTEPEPIAAPTEAAPEATIEAVPPDAAPIVPEPPPVRAGDLVEFTAVDTEPVAISKPKPRYNAVAKQAKQQGDVVLNVLIDENGAVTDVNVLKGIEGSMLDDAAIRAVRKWTYEPATKDGVPVKVWTMEIISFRL